MTNKEIREKIEQLTDEEYRKFHSNLCPNVNNIIGVKVPNLRIISKEILKGDFKYYLDNAKDSSYEEVMLQGMVIGAAKLNLKELKNYLNKFIPKIDNWAVCDVTVTGLKKQVEKYKKEMLEYIKTYLKSNKEFELRFAIVMIIDYYITDENIDEVLRILNNIKHDGYYVKMAVSWAISICYIKFPKETMELLQNNKLDKFTYNKALQKIIESYRIDDKTKDKIRKLKRK